MSRFATQHRPGARTWLLAGGLALVLHGGVAALTGLWATRPVAGAGMGEGGLMLALGPASGGGPATGGAETQGGGEDGGVAEAADAGLAADLKAPVAEAPVTEPSIAEPPVVETAAPSPEPPAEPVPESVPEPVADASPQPIPQPVPEPVVRAEVEPPPPPPPAPPPQALVTPRDLPPPPPRPRRYAAVDPAHPAPEQQAAETAREPESINQLAATPPGGRAVGEVPGPAGAAEGRGAPGFGGGTAMPGGVGGAAPGGGASAGGGGGGALGDGAVDDYAARLIAWLEAHKRYPRKARLRRQEGTALVRVVIDRQGRVLSRDLGHGSGHASLDAAALELIDRAQPLPAVPAHLGGHQLSLSVPIRYHLR
ncbi:energy transducer TonB [Roseospirillum parvum]|uniref:Protein TonB n=1 Tax=Roseospirillum parvum TaxID=83401 RepID=A0A1G8AMQ4_9PROT|nr:energy transducer TonB [Roseospirillum parvum]SDH22224.1 protein TonB [Roseospirillum parvum]